MYTISNLLSADNLNEESFLKIKGIGFRNNENQIILNEPEIVVPKKLLENDLPGIAQILYLVIRI